MSSYSRDVEVELRGRFPDQDGNPVDPTDVTLAVRAPDGTVSHYDAADLTRQGPGVYTRLVVLDQTGVWNYRFKAAPWPTAWKRIDVIDDPFS